MIGLEDRQALARHRAALLEQIVVGRWALHRRVTTEGAVELILRWQTQARLSPSQARVVARSAAGRSGKEIAIDLGVGESTISRHLGAALDRLRLTRSELGVVTSGLAANSPEGTEGIRYLVLEEDGHDALRVQVSWTERLSDALTDAEKEVVVGVMSGLTNREIAASRWRSQRTVANQLASIFRKLRVASRAELFAFHTGSARPTSGG